MSCTNRIVSGFCVMIRQCCQYNLQRLTINIAMCFFMSCLNYLIVVFFFLSFYAEQRGLILFFSSGLTTPLITPVTQVRFTYKSLQILLEETKQGGEITISSSGMTTPLITSVNPSANIEFGWVLW